MKSQAIFQLISKDFKVYFWPIIGWTFFAATYGVYLLLVENNVVSGAFVNISMFIAMVSIMPFIPERVFNNTWVHMASLPVTRKAIIVSRYLSSLIIFLLNLVIWYLSFTILESVLGYEQRVILTPKVFLMILANTLFSWAIFYFAFYRFNLIINIIFLPLSLLLPMILRITVSGTKSGFNPFFGEMDWAWFIMENLVIWGIFAFSIYLSLSYFQKKDI